MKKIFLSETNKKLGGVIGGIGETYDIDPTLLRIFVILLAILTGFVPVIVAYFLVWLVMPHKSNITVEEVI